MGYDYGYDMLRTAGNASSGFAGSVVWLIVAFVLSVVGCLAAYFLFVKNNTKLNNKFLVWLRDFLRFDKMLIETILKITYIFTALFITLGSFAFIGVNFLCFLCILIFGNILARVIYEALLIMIMIWKNTTDIKKGLKK